MNSYFNFFHIILNSNFNTSILNVKLVLWLQEESQSVENVTSAQDSAFCLLSCFMVAITHISKLNNHCLLASMLDLNWWYFKENWNAKDAMLHLFKVHSLWLLHDSLDTSLPVLKRPGTSGLGHRVNTISLHFITARKLQKGQILYSAGNGRCQNDFSSCTSQKLKQHQGI